MALERSAMLIAPTRLENASCSHHNDGHCCLHGTMSVDLIESTQRTRREHVPDEIKKTTLVIASYACEKWPCQAPSHGIDACGLGRQRTVAKEAEGLFPQTGTDQPSTLCQEYLGQGVVRRKHLFLVSFVV